MSLGNVADGLISATYLIPLSLAFCLAANHGKYLPLWLPYVGLVGAYIIYATSEVLGIPVMWALGIGFFSVPIISLILHSTLFQGHVERAEPYLALLRAIAITVFIEALLGWATSGYALSYRRLRFDYRIHLTATRVITIADLLAIISALVLPAVVAFILRRMWIGLAFRSVASNRSLAREYGISVSGVDLAVLTLSGGLSVLGALMYGMKYDLSPHMLAEPTMRVAAAVVAFGSERPERVIAGILLLGVVEAIAQASVFLAPFAAAIGYLLLISALLIRYATSLRPSNLET